MRINDQTSVRFKGFLEKWKENKMSDLATFSKGSGYSKSDLVDCGIPILLYGQLYTNYKTIISSVNNYVIEKEKSVFSCGNEVVVPASGESSEDIARASAIVTPNIIIGGDLNIIRPMENIEPAFLALSLSHGKTHGQLKKLAQGKSVVHLQNSEIKKVVISYPSINEQIQIGSFFKSLDDTISLHQQELEALKQTKQGFLQKMFPKNKDTVPEIRFPGFQDAWNEYKLGDLMKVTSVKRIHQSDWTDSGVRFLRARDIVSTFNRKRTDDYLYISKEKYQQYSLISGKVAKNDVLVTGVGSIGVPMLITDDNPVYFKDGNIIWFKNEDKINGYFLYYSFVGSRIQKFIKNIAGIGTVGTYTIDSGKKTPILLPSKEEQIKIGEFFRQLDEVIELKEKELDALKETKKGFLQKMFV